MRKFKSAALALLLATCGVIHADVLETLPADALVCGKVANLQATCKKIANLASQLGVDAFAPDLKDPLAALKSRGHLQDGVKDDGELGVAYMDPKAAGVAEDDAFIFVVPVTSYEAFLGNFTATPTKNGVSSIVPKDGNVGKPMFIADWNGYAAISPTEALVTKPATMLKVPEAATKESARQDFLVVANFNVLRPLLMPQLDKGAETITAEIDKESKEFDPKYKPLMKVGVGQLIAAAKTFLNSTDAATFGVNISEQGINTTLMSGFKADSYMGKMATDLKGTDKPLTIGLPAMRYLAYGGSALDPAISSRLFDDLFGPILAELQKIDGIPDAKKLTADFTAAMKKNTGTSFAMPVPLKIGEEGILQQITVYHGSGPEMKALATDGGAFGKQFIAEMKLAPDRPKPILEQTANDKSIEGVNFDTIKFDAKPDPNDPQAAMQTQMMGIMYGPNGLTYHYGVLGNDFVMTSGASDEVVGTFIKALKANDESVSKADPIKAVAAELPKMRVLEYYVALDEMVNTGVQTAAQFGLPVQVQLPPELPPLGITFGGDGTSLRIDTHLPTATVQALIAAGMQAVMGMRGGGGNL